MPELEDKTEPSLLHLYLKTEERKYLFTELSSGLTLIRVRVGVVLFLLGSQSSAGAVRAETVASSSVPVRVRVSSP